MQNQICRCLDKQRRELRAIRKAVASPVTEEPEEEPESKPSRCCDDAAVVGVSILIGVAGAATTFAGTHFVGMSLIP